MARKPTCSRIVQLTTIVTNRASNEMVATSIKEILKASRKKRDEYIKVLAFNGVAPRVDLSWSEDARYRVSRSLRASRSTVVTCRK